MSGSLEEAYVAVERAYGQGDFATALQLAEALQPQVPAGRPDLLDQRLFLLLGHIHLYGLNQPTPAATAYAAVLERCAEPSYRELASQGLELSRQQMPAEPEPQQPELQPEPPTTPAMETETVAAATEPPAAATPAVQTVQAVQAMDQLPATPWLSQLQDPQQALEQIQAAWATAAPPQPAPVEPAASSAPSASDAAEAPWQPEPEAASTPEPQLEPQLEPQIPMEAEASPAGSSVEEGTSSLVAQSLDQSGGSTADNPEPASAATDAQTIIPVVVRVEEDNPATDQPGTTGEVSATEDATSEEPVAAPEPSGPRFSEEEWADLSRGLLLVELSSHQGD